MLLETTFRREGLFLLSVSAYHTREGTLEPLSSGQQEHIVEVVQEAEVAGIRGWASHQRPTPSDYLFQLSPPPKGSLTSPNGVHQSPKDLPQGCILSWSSEVLPLTNSHLIFYS